MRINTQNIPNSARSHYDINSVIHMNLITTNNVSLSHNSTHVRLLQENTLNDPTFRVTTRGHHQQGGNLPWRPRESQSDTASLPTNCFLHNIESPPPTNIRCILSRVKIATNAPARTHIGANEFRRLACCR